MFFLGYHARRTRKFLLYSQRNKYVAMKNTQHSDGDRTLQIDLRNHFQKLTCEATQLRDSVSPLVQFVD